MSDTAAGAAPGAPGSVGGATNAGVAGAPASRATSDTELARRLTAAVQATAGIATVFPTRPILHVASEGIANALELDEPEILVDVDRVDETLTITAHVATLADRSTPQTLTDAAEAIRAAAEREGLEPTAILVKARFIDADTPAAP